jgi:hypothetical protein
LKADWTSIRRRVVVERFGGEAWVVEVPAGAAVVDDMVGGGLVGWI